LLTRIARIVAWPFWPGATYAEGGFKIALCSMALALFYLFAAQWQFPGGASQFPLYAKVWMEGGTLSSLASRDIGYPLLLLLGGYGVTQSFIGVLAVHVVLAWSIPVVVYATFGSEYRHLGYYTAAAVAFSMTPYLYLKFIHHDLAYMAFSVLSLWLLVKYLHRGRIAVLYGFLAAIVATCLTRPAGNLLFLPLLLLIWVFRPARWRHYLIVAAIFAAVLAAYSVHRDKLLGQTPDGDRPSYFGRQIFYNLYINSAEYGISITPQLGPATARLVEKARKEVAEHPLDSPYVEEWYRAHGFPQQAKEFWFTRYVGRDEEFVSSLFRHPSHDSYEYLCLAEKRDVAFRDAAFEIVRAYPLYPFQYGLRNLVIFLWSPGVAHGRFGLEHDNFMEEYLYFLPGGRSVAEGETETALAPPGRYELRRSGSAGLQPLLERIEVVWRGKYHRVNRTAICLAVIASIAAVFLGGRFRAIVAVTALFLLYNAAITAAFAEPNYRYHFFVFPMVLILAGAGAIALLRGFFHLHDAFPSLGRPTLITCRSWSVEAPPTAHPPALRWKTAGLALCGTAIFAVWAMMTWQAAVPA
jgi:hypothetical protein